MDARLSLLLLLGCATPEPTTTPPLLRLATDHVDLGGIACGTAGSAVLRVTNDGGAPLEAVLRSTLPGVTIVPDRVTLGEADFAEIEITAAIPEIAAPGLSMAGDLVIESNGGSTTLPVTFMPTGAVVTLEAPTVDYGIVLPFSGVDRDLVVTVAGTEGVTVALGAPTRSEYIVKTSQATIAAGTSAPMRITMLNGTTEGVLAATVPITITGNLCAPPPAVAQLTTTVTRDLLTATPEIDFGSPACGESATRTIELANRSDSDARYDLFFLDVAGFLGPLPQQGTAPAATTSTVTLVHRAMPDELAIAPGTYTALVDVEWPDPAVFRRIAVTTTIDRPVLRVDTDEIDVGEVPAGSMLGFTVRVTNTGSKLDTVTVGRAVPDAPTSTTFSPQAFQLAPGETQVVEFNVRSNAEGEIVDGVRLDGACGSAISLARMIAR